MQHLWGYNETLSDVGVVTGYDVEAVDGSIGRIDEASDTVDSAHIVVDTGFWIFGKKRLIPAGVVERVDSIEQKVYVSLSKEQIKNAPDYDTSWTNDESMRSAYSDYFQPFGGRR